VDVQIWQDEQGRWHTRPLGEEGEGTTWGRRRPGIRRLAKTYRSFVHLEEIRCPVTQPSQAEHRVIIWNDSQTGDMSEATGMRNSVSRVWTAQVMQNGKGGFTWGVLFMNKAYHSLNVSSMAATLADGKQAVQQIIDKFAIFKEFWYCAGAARVCEPRQGRVLR